ncbi:DUF6604 domain-containing protein (Fragment) [Madurella fahalii]|uniref:DUF6604 domain-containing protein n=1 Tax=Madurella fahalii TaxID=1157608 RepID=A0ABQ0GK09_9PEZI
MASHSNYLAYKRDTSKLLYWMIKTYNNIIETLEETYDDGTAANTTGEITVSRLVELSRLIADHITSVPPVIFQLFRSVIDNRTATHKLFEQLAAKSADPEIKKSNASHKHFIDALTEAYHILGGKDWEDGAPESSADAGTAADSLPAKEDLDRLVLENKFSVLTLERGGYSDEESGESSGEESDKKSRQAPTSISRSRQPRPGRGKKSKRGAKAKKQQKRQKLQKQQKTAEATDSSLDHLPLESYRIIPGTDEGGLEYLLAVCCLVDDMIDHRAYLQNFWRDCAYDGLNTAVAGTMSNLVIATVQRTLSVMFADFPDRQSYESIIHTIACCSMEKAQNKPTLVRVCGEQGSEVQETTMDIKEQCMIYTYHALVDFLEDFQKTRSGKPTKRMLKEIRDWDATLDLQRATEEQRIQWRRSYTINWLYDLVNLFSFPVVQHNATQGEKHVLEKVDWSPQGPWAKHRRLFGLDEFVGLVTSLAMQKPGTNIRHRILPHHVFQLQCMVDSFMVSRGWFSSIMCGHVLTPPAQEFQSRRDINLFLGQQNEHQDRGFLRAVDKVKAMFRRDSFLSQASDRHQANCELLERFQAQFSDWLGQSKCRREPDGVPPSRFSDSTSNGLWEYSPFLCGVGLAEGLELAYRVGMRVWDKATEPLLLIHLNNMLMKKGYIKNSVPLCDKLQELLLFAFYVRGKIPATDFAFRQAIRDKIGTGARPGRATNGLFTANQETADLDDNSVLDIEANEYFNVKSHLLLYRESNWNYNAIPDADLILGFSLFFLRLAQANHVVDPATGRIRLEDTEPVRRAKAAGWPEHVLLLMIAATKSKLPEPHSWPSSDTEQPAGTASAGGGSGSGRPEIHERYLFEFFKLDIFNEVCGDHARAGFNYVAATEYFLAVFSSIEQKLREQGNRLYQRARNSDLGRRGQARVALTLLAITEEDEECLRIIAEVLEQHPAPEFEGFIYWDGLRRAVDMMERAAEVRRDQPENTSLIILSGTAKGL